jgi:hypothetical protein
MPKIFELFGFPVHDRSVVAEQFRKAALCPFMQATCDGGGNRHQTRIRLNAEEPLRQYFDQTVHNVIPGICSITAGKDVWVVCPRRLFAAKNAQTVPPIPNFALQPHERSILLAAGLPEGQEIGVWSEVFLKQKVDDTEINYHFDYVIMPLEYITFSMFLQKLGLNEDVMAQEVALFSTIMRKRGYHTGAARDVRHVMMQLPSMDCPIIFEVMTASTSGSDTVNETDIRNAFRNVILNRDHSSPSINKRQVWGRMVTQLFAKTSLASFWGGKTVWIIQDELLRNIELTTLLQISRIQSKVENNINLAIMEYTEPANGTRVITFKESLAGTSGLVFTGSNTFTDILLPKITPSKLELARAVLRRPIEAIVRL